MAKTPKYQRESIKRLYRQRREQKRCELVKSKLQEFKENNADLYEQRDEINQQIEDLKVKKQPIEGKIFALKKEAGLANIDRHRRIGCDIDKINPEIRNFDRETEDVVLEIMSKEKLDFEDYNIKV